MWNTPRDKQNYIEDRSSINMYVVDSRVEMWYAFKWRNSGAFFNIIYILNFTLTELKLCLIVLEIEKQILTKQKKWNTINYKNKNYPLRE